MKDNPLRPVIVIFIILTGFFVSAKSLIQKWGMDPSVLIIGNLVLFLVTFISFQISKKGLKSDNPHAVVRSIYSSFLVKLFLCIGVAMIYILTVKKDVNKPALFVCMGLYLIYSFLEVSVLTKMTKKKKNA